MPRQVTGDMPRKMLVDFRVTWNWLAFSSGGMPIEIVPFAMPKECAAGRFKGPDEIPPLHTVISLTA